MTSSILEVGRWFAVITGELVALFLGVTFLVGLLTEYVSPERVQSVLGERHPVLSGIIATAFGALTPFCSCSTIPMLVGMMQAGVPFGAASSFLIASPLLNPVIVIMLVTMLGFRVGMGYFGLVFVFSVVSGLIWDHMGLAADIKKVKIVRNTKEETKRSAGTGNVHHDHLMNALAFALALFRQVLPYLIIGAGIGAFIYGFVPEDLIVRLAGPKTPLAIPIAAALGVPMYIRAETMIPIGVVLVSKGMSMGAVVALLIAGAGASIPELTLLGSIFKERTLVAFALTVFSVAVLTGLLVNLIL